MASKGPSGAGIRRAEPGDYAGVRAVLQTCLPEAYGEHVNRWQIRRSIDTYTRKAHRQLCREMGELFRVATVGGRVVGIVQAATGEDGNGWLRQLRVLPEYRGRWIGKRLLNRAQEFLHWERGHAEMYAAAPNANARRFLQRQAGELVDVADVGSGMAEHIYRTQIHGRWRLLSTGGEPEVPDSWMVGVYPGNQRQMPVEAIDGQMMAFGM